MIKSFAHKGLQQFYYDGVGKRIKVSHRAKLSDILDILDSASDIHETNFPGSGLHKLKGPLREYWSVKVSGNWRIIFRFRDGDVFNINYVDYH